jgi:hypothetical protein
MKVKQFVIVILVFAALAALTYYPVWQGQVPFPDDIFSYFPAYQDTPKPEPQNMPDVGDLMTSFYPFRSVLTNSVSEGVLPLWNPHMLSGAPFLGHSQTGLFYPPNLVYYLLPMPLAWTSSFLLRMVLAGFLMTLLMRALGATDSGALLSGIVFSMCGVITTWQGWSRGDTCIWLPFVCYAVVRLRQSPSGRSLGLVAVAFTMPILAGHPETAVHITMVGVSLMGILWVWPADPGQKAFDLRFPLLFAAAGIFAVGLASIQMLPTIEFLKQMPSRFEIAWPALPTSQAIALVSRDIVRSPNSAGFGVPEAAAYTGMVTLLLAALAPFFKNKRYVLFFGLVTIITLAIVYSIPPMPWLIGHSPIKVLKNSRMILLFSFGIAALAGMGLSGLQQEDQWTDRKRRLRALLVLVVMFVAAFLLYYALRESTTMRVEFMRRPSFSRAMLFLGTIPILLRLLGLFRGRFFAIFVCAIAAFDLATFSTGYTGYSQPENVFPKEPVFEYLLQRGRTSEFRIVQLGGPYPVNAPTFYGLEAADGYEILMQRPRNFVEGLTLDNYSLIQFDARPMLQLNDRRMDLLNIKYFVIQIGSLEWNLLQPYPDRYPMIFRSDHVAVFENKRALPRAFAVPASGVEVIPTYPASMNRVKDPGFDPEKEVVLSSEPFPAKALVSSGGEFHQKVETRESDANGYQFRVNVSAPAILVVSQTYYPGWKARVDGKSVPLQDADYALAGVPVPAGEHDVDVRLEPDSLRRGEWLAGLSALGLIGLALFDRRLAKDKNQSV